MHSIFLEIELKNLLPDFCFLSDNLQLAIGALGVAQELRVIEECPTALYAAALTELHILTVGLALCLAQSIKSADFKANPYIHFLWPSDISDDVNVSLPNRLMDLAKIKSILPFSQFFIIC